VWLQREACDSRARRALGARSLTRSPRPSPPHYQLLVLAHARLRRWRQLVDFQKLDMGTLKRYKKIYRLKTRQNVTKADLASACARDFASRVVDEAETINNFLYHVQEQRDNNPVK
jgi:hypothetical protein